MTVDARGADSEPVCTTSAAQQLTVFDLADNHHHHPQGYTAAAHKFDRKLTELQYRGALQKWLRYAPERSGRVPRKGKD
ncbi:unnamed protein product [Boreogadus saida]